MSQAKRVMMLAEFENPAQLLKAAKQLRNSRFKNFDCYSPFPIHGLDKAMGEKRSMLGWVAGIIAAIGLSVGVLLQWWTGSVAYPVVVSGKPLFSYQAYSPVAFALMVISGAATAFVGMLIFNKLPRFNHPIFESERFKKVTDDGFFVSIEGDEGEFDLNEARTFLESIGGKNVELITEEAEDDEKA
ncbi:DUF3341 domain-containing protein [Calditrichota bacterium GD2]